LKSGYEELELQNLATYQTKFTGKYINWERDFVYISGCIRGSDQDLLQKISKGHSELVAKCHELAIRI
jgi:hypothetical protein